jgi:hypothetical protein
VSGPSSAYLQESEVRELDGASAVCKQSRNYRGPELVGPMWEQQPHLVGIKQGGRRLPQRGFSSPLARL